MSKKEYEGKCWGLIFKDGRLNEVIPSDSYIKETEYGRGHDYDEYFYIGKKRVKEVVIETKWYTLEKRLKEIFYTYEENKKLWALIQYSKEHADKHKEILKHISSSILKDLLGEYEAAQTKMEKKLKKNEENFLKEFTSKE